MKCYNFYISDDGVMFDNYQDCKTHEILHKERHEPDEGKFWLKTKVSHIQTALCADFTMDDCALCPKHNMCVNFSPADEKDALDYLDELATFVCDRKGVYD